MREPPPPAPIWYHAAGPSPTEGRNNMSHEINNPESVRYLIARNNDGTVIHLVETHPGQVTTTGQPVLEVTDDAAARLALLADFAASFPELPESGWLEAGARYRHGGQVVEVRQAHERTIYPPEDTPALFVVAREEGDRMEWIAGESVGLGEEREHDGARYRALQAHITQAGWEPPHVPALWVVVEPETPGEPEVVAWAPGQPVAIGDLRTHNGQVWRALVAHVTHEGWAPSQFTPTIWELI